MTTLERSLVSRGLNGRYSHVWRRFRRHKLAMLGLAFLALTTALAIFAPWIAPHNPDALDLATSGGIPVGPSWAHPFGTDDLGRDILSRVIYGGRVSLFVGFLAMAISVTVGATLGAVSAYAGGWLDNVIMRVVDVLMSIPTFFLILSLNANLTPSVWNVIIAIGLLSWMPISRIVRGEVLSLMNREYVQAARAVGARAPRILFRHLLPNAMAPIIVQATLGIAEAILMESALSFLGMGVQQPMSSWGSMLQASKQYIDSAWWMSVFPGLFISLTVLGFNFVGDSLRDALDPRLSR